jgi:hypothetical protein
MFEPLKNREFFNAVKNAVKIEQGGYAVSWSTDIDISEYELWSKGKVSLAHQQFGT